MTTPNIPFDVMVNGGRPDGWRYGHEAKRGNLR